MTTTERVIVQISTDGPPATVTGTLFTLPGYPGFSFLLHRSYNRKHGWAVTEPETGCYMLVTARTQAQTIERLKQRMVGVTPISLRATINALLRRRRRP